MIAIEIVVAIIGGSVTLISPFIALGIRKYCENVQPVPQPVSQPVPQPVPQPLPKSICEIYTTSLPFAIADKRYCYLKKAICPHCNKTFCEYHLSVNTLGNYGGHICTEYKP